MDQIIIVKSSISESVIFERVFLNTYTRKKKERKINVGEAAIQLSQLFFIILFYLLQWQKKKITFS